MLGVRRAVAIGQVGEHSQIGGRHLVVKETDAEPAYGAGAAAEARLVPNGLGRGLSRRWLSWSASLGSPSRSVSGSLHHGQLSAHETLPSQERTSNRTRGLDLREHRMARDLLSWHVIMTGPGERR